MFGLSKYKNFNKWAERNDIFYNTPARQKMLHQYHQLETPEQRLYAACTSFAPELYDLIKEELDSVTDNRREQVIQVVKAEFERRGLHGCSFNIQRIFKTTES